MSLGFSVKFHLPPKTANHLHFTCSQNHFPATSIDILIVRKMTENSKYDSKYYKMQQAKGIESQNVPSLKIKEVQRTI